MSVCLSINLSQYSKLFWLFLLNFPEDLENDCSKEFNEYWKIKLGPFLQQAWKLSPFRSAQTMAWLFTHSYQCAAIILEYMTCCCMSDAIINWFSNNQLSNHVYVCNVAEKIAGKLLKYFISNKKNSYNEESFVWLL